MARFWNENSGAGFLFMGPFQATSADSLFRDQINLFSQNCYHALPQVDFHLMEFSAMLHLFRLGRNSLI